MIVAMVQRLDDHDTEVQPTVELVLDGVFGFHAGRGFDQLIPSGGGQLPQRINARPRVILEATFTSVAKPTEVPLLSAHKVLPRGCDRAVRARGGQLQLLLS